MKKRVLAGILMMVFVLASVMGVSAANSATADVTVVEDSKGYYIIRTGAEQFMDDKGTQDTADDAFVSVKPDIDAYNAGTKTLAQLLANYSDVAKALEGKQALTTIVDLHDVDGGDPAADGKHYVTVKVPTLTDKCSDVKVLHYSMKDSKWEIVESKVDVAKQIVTVISDDLSPIAIFANVSTGSATGTSPSTAGTSSAWMLWTAAALIVLGAGVVVSKKRS